MVSFVYGLGALLNIGVFASAPRLLRKYGVIKLTLSLTLIEAVALIFLAFPLYAPVALIAFLLHISTATVLLYCLDIMLEHYDTSKNTGSLRGIYLTMWNLPPIITPLIAGLILENGNTNIIEAGSKAVALLHIAGFWKIYIIAAIFLIPFVIIIRANFMNFKDPEYPKMDTRATLQSFYKDKNIFDIFTDRLLLNLYYAWNAVYLPIYLHEYIGFSWDEVGIILSVMLLPYILLQRYIGKVEDEKHSEKRILIIGFFILAFATAIMPLFTIQNLVLWCTLLFITHIGGAFIEVSSESYFFRHIHPNNSGYISFFRLTRTLPYIIVPFLAMLTFSFLPFSYGFMVLGIIMCLGIRYAFLLGDESKNEVKASSELESELESESEMVMKDLPQEPIRD